MRNLFTILLILNTYGVLSQVHGDRYIDSLISEVDKLPQDSNKVYLLEKVAIAYSKTNPEQGLKYSFDAYNLAVLLNLKKREAAALSIIGINYAAASDFEKGIEYNKAALKIYEATNDKSGIAAVSSNLSLNYVNLGQYSEALKCNFVSLTIYESQGQNENTGIVLENIAGIYYELKDYDQSIKYYEQGLRCYRKSNSKRSIARCLGNVSRVYMDKGDYETALILLKQSLSINQEEKSQVSVLINLTNIGLVYLKQNDFKNALIYLGQSLNMSIELNFINFIAINKGNIGSLYLTQFKTISGKNQSYLDSSIVFLTDAVIICDSIGLSAPKTEFLQELSDAHALRGSFAEAYLYLKEKIETSEYIHSNDAKQELMHLEKKREVDLKNKDLIIKTHELEILKLNKERLIFFYSLVIIILAIMLVLAVRYFRLRQKKYSKFVAHLNQVQSHEVRGPIATILGLIQILQTKKYTEEERENILKGIEEMALKLNDTVTDITNNS